MKIGLISDIQYCDCDDCWNYEKTKERFYRNSINHLDHALEYFLKNDCKNILQLGDLIDGRCQRFKNFDNAKQLMIERFESDLFETFHVTGNHELYNFSREELRNSFIGSSLRKYRKSDSDINYYRVHFPPNISLIVIDTYEISVLNKRDSQESSDCLLAKNILMANNPNESWNEPIGATKAKFVAFNGAIGIHQLHWLEEQLTLCEKDNDIVIIAGHIPLLSESENPLCMIWNADQLLQIVERFPCVKAYICGHNHFPSVITTDKFIHVTLPGIIEAAEKEQPYGILEITDNKIIISDMSSYWKKAEFNF